MVAMGTKMAVEGRVAIALSTDGESFQRSMRFESSSLFFALKSFLNFQHRCDAMLLVCLDAAGRYGRIGE
jgi:hypothetical protein